MNTTLQTEIGSPKWQRTYQLSIESLLPNGGGPGPIYNLGSQDGSQPLLTIEFNVIRNAMASAQTGNIRIRNLNAATRNAIFKDFFMISYLPSVVLKAGYVGSPLSTIFNGKATSIYSYRESGGTDWITEIIGTDYSSLFSNSFSSWTEDPGTGKAYTQQQVITHLVSDLQNTAKGYNQTLGIGVVGGFFTPRYSYTANGFTMDLLNTETSRLAYIDNGSIYIIPSNGVFQGNVEIISSNSGLIGSPKISTTQVVAQMIFEPGIQPGQQILLDTEIIQLNSARNGVYKVFGLQHAGTISSTVGGKVITTLTMQYIPNPQAMVPGIYQK